MNDSNDVTLGTDGQITIPIQIPGALAHSDVQWSVFSALVTTAIEETLQTGEIARVLSQHDVRLATGKRARVLNEARGDRL